MYRLVITDGYGLGREEWIPVGYEPVFLSADCDPALRREALASAQVIVGEPESGELREARRLLWVQMTWAGGDRYLHGSFPPHVQLTTASGAFGDTIAEHALAMALSLCRRLPGYRTAREDLGTEKSLLGSCVLILGAGDIGSSIARRVQALGAAQVLGVCRDPSRPRPGFHRLLFLQEAENVLPLADFVFCALPGGPDTDRWFTGRRLALLPRDGILVNVGRGSLICTEDLTEQVKAGRFFGVGLDVTDPEPLPEAHPLRACSRVILTPHVAGVSFGHLPRTEEKIWKIIRENLIRFSRGESLRNRLL